MLKVYVVGAVLMAALLAALGMVLAVEAFATRQVSGTAAEHGASQPRPTAARD